MLLSSDFFHRCARGLSSVPQVEQKDRMTEVREPEGCLLPTFVLTSPELGILFVWFLEFPGIRSIVINETR